MLKRAEAGWKSKREIQGDRGSEVYNVGVLGWMGGEEHGRGNYRKRRGNIITCWLTYRRMDITV